jgi:8-oxo-dGTP pyrophosphatase MutT (NUDIX family)
MPQIEPVTAAGGVLYRRDGREDPQVVLIYRNKVWDLPKGKIEPGETVEECAIREVAEEIGLSDLPEIVQKLTETYHEYEREGTRYGKTTYWFSMQLSSGLNDGFVPAVDEGIEKVKWATLSDAEQVVGYENLFDVLTAFRNRIDQ